MSRKRFSYPSIIAALAALPFIFFAGGTAFAATTLAVNASGVDCTGGTAAAVYSTIQAAVTAAGASPGTIIVCDGTYTEQVTVTGAGDLTITAYDLQKATVEPPVGATGPVIHVVDSENVTIDSLTVDGAGFTTGCNPGDARIAGIRYDDSSGTVSNNLVENIKLPSGLNGCQEGNGIWVASDTSGTSIVTINDNTVTNYQKTGIVVNEPGSSATVTDNSVEGFGQTLGIAQNGIQFGFGASGEARANAIGNDYYLGAGWTASGLLLFDVDANSVKHSLNKFQGVQTNMALVTTEACPAEYDGFYQDYNLCPQ